MSLCRFSSMNFKCQVYCYESENGYVIHLADNKHVGDIPEVPSVGTIPNEEWIELYKKRNDALDNAKREKITLPYAGESFYNLTFEEMIEQMKELKEIGYIFPQYILTMKDDEE